MRVSENDRDALQRAAATLCMSMSEFVLRQSVPKAEAILKRAGQFLKN
jgi:uncharacterized protein (DUF1778 family)